MVEGRRRPASGLPGGRVVDGHRGAARLERGGHGQRRGVAHVVAAGLERRAPHADPRAGDGAAEHGGGGGDRTAALAQVDVVDDPEQVRHAVDAELSGAVAERADVLGQAAAAEPDAGGQEAVADPHVVAERLGQRDHVGPGRVADLRDGVDEGDLGGQEGVGRDLDQLGGGQVGDQHRHAGVLERGVQLAQHLAAEALALGAVRVDADHDPVRAQRVLHGVALAQELGVPDQLGVGAGGGQLRDPAGQAGGGADRDRGLPDDVRRPVQVHRQPLDRPVDLGEVGAPAVAALRRADAEEVQVGVGGGVGEGVGEAQPAGRDVGGQQGVQAGLVEGQLAAREQRPLPGVGLDAEHVVAQLGQAGGVGGAQVAAADDGDPHASSVRRAGDVPIPLAGGDG